MPKRHRDSESPAADGTADVERTEPKPPATFNGALAKFAFKPSKPITRSATKLSTPIRAISRTLSRTMSIKPEVSSSPSQSQTTSTASSPAPKKKKKKPRHPGYADPSTYAHLTGIADSLSTGLILVFIGTNPGLSTARTGHAYAAPSNLFWRLLHSSGLTPDRRLNASEHLSLPELYSLGNTNLVARPTKDQAELSRHEMEASVPVLEEKIRRYKPEAVCVVGKGVWERIYRVKAGKAVKSADFAFGWQEDWRLGAEEGEGEGRWEGAKVYVAVSTSGLVAGYTPKRKEEIFRELGDWVNKRREERGEEAPRNVERAVVEEAARRREEEWRRGLEEAGAGVKVEGEGEGVAKKDVPGLENEMVERAVAATEAGEIVV